MKKYIKILTVIMLSVLIAFPSSSYAYTPEEQKIENRSGTYYTKKVLSETDVWGYYDRVSDNVYVNPNSTGTISVTKNYTYTASISGDIFGINVNTGGSVSTEVGHSLSTSSPGHWYMGFKLKYRVEKGIRYKHSGWSGQILDSNEYEVRVPLYGEYSLIKDY